MRMLVNEYARQGRGGSATTIRTAGYELGAALALLLVLNVGVVLGAITGPLIGGALLTAGIAYPWGFYIFAAVAAIGAVCVAAVALTDVPAVPDRSE